MACLAPGQSALVRFPVLASDSPFHHTSNQMTFDFNLEAIQLNSIETVGKARFIREIEVVLDENKKFVPQMFMAPNDPMLAQLIELGSLEVVLNERIGRISTWGSYLGLSEFAKLCSWPAVEQATRWSNVAPSKQQSGPTAVRASLSCQHPTSLDGQIMQMRITDDQSGSAILTLPSFTARGRSFSPPELGSWERNGTVFVDRAAIEAGGPSDWQVMMNQMSSDDGAAIARMELDVPDYGVIECDAQIIQ